MLLSTYRVTYQAPESVLGIEKVEFGGLKTVTLVVVWMPEAAEVCRSTRLVSRSLHGHSVRTPHSGERAGRRISAAQIDNAYWTILLLTHSKYTIGPLPAREKFPRYDPDFLSREFLIDTLPNVALGAKNRRVQGLFGLIFVRSSYRRRSSCRSTRGPGPWAHGR
jgi:hypothetical protein